MSPLKLPRYRCHKDVRAGKILAVEHITETSNSAYRLVLEGDLTHAVSHDWYVKHGPRPDGYLVIYEDGYHSYSYSPPGPFESGYTRIEEESHG